jgi:molybdenum cofactor cytidylyltransferase
MGARNKLLCEIDGTPMLLHAVNAACTSRCVQTLLVSGYQTDAIEALVNGRPLSLVRNADYATGMASSLRCGLRALPHDIDGVIVLLADMPRVTAAHIDRLIAAFDKGKPAIVVPEKDGCRGNPILWPRRHFSAMLALDGDQGARGILERHTDEVLCVAFDDDAIFIDVDTPGALLQVAIG